MFQRRRFVNDSFVLFCPMFVQYFCLYQREISFQELLYKVLSLKLIRQKRLFRHKKISVHYCFIQCGLKVLSSCQVGMQNSLYKLYVCINFRLVQKCIGGLKYLHQLRVPSGGKSFFFSVVSTVYKTKVLLLNVKFHNTRKMLVIIVIPEKN